MQISTSGGEITISGNIESFDDYLDINKTVKSMVHHQGLTSITVKVVDSLVMTSSVIGLFIRLVMADNVRLNMYVQNDKLYSLMDTLNLVDIFNIKKL